MDEIEIPSQFRLHLVRLIGVREVPKTPGTIQEVLHIIPKKNEPYYNIYEERSETLQLSSNTVYNLSLGLIETFQSSDYYWLLSPTHPDPRKRYIIYHYDNHQTEAFFSWLFTKIAPDAKINIFLRHFDKLNLSLPIHTIERMQIITVSEYSFKIDYSGEISFCVVPTFIWQPYFVGGICGNPDFNWAYLQHITKVPNDNVVYQIKKLPVVSMIPMIKCTMVSPLWRDGSNIDTMFMPFKGKHIDPVSRDYDLISTPVFDTIIKAAERILNGEKSTIDRDHNYWASQFKSSKIDSIYESPIKTPSSFPPVIYSQSCSSYIDPCKSAGEGMKHAMHSDLARLVDNRRIGSTELDREIRDSYLKRTRQTQPISSDIQIKLDELAGTMEQQGKILATSLRNRQTQSMWDSRISDFCSGTNTTVTVPCTDETDLLTKFSQFIDEMTSNDPEDRPESIRFAKVDFVKVPELVDDPVPIAASSSSQKMLDCRICLDSFLFEDLRVLPCNHGFCSGCMIRLFQSSRAKMIDNAPPPEDTGLGSDTDLPSKTTVICPMCRATSAHESEQTIGRLYI